MTTVHNMEEGREILASLPHLPERIDDFLDLQEEIIYRPPIIREKTALSFDDVLLAPKFGVLTKRADADLSTWLARDIKLTLPIISAPMQSVTEFDMAVAMHYAGGFGIIHRFQTPDEQSAIFSGLRDNLQDRIFWMGAAIGVNEGYHRYQMLYNSGCRVFCLDIAHAHHAVVGEFFKHLPRNGDEYLIAGNVATALGADYLANHGIDAIKVGVGPGAACTTREVTGFGVPQLTAIMEASSIKRHWPQVRIIADGGIRTSGDIVKALAAGADSVMLGRLLAGADESPHPGLYWGMASKRVNSHRAPEGVEGTVPHTGPIADTLKQLAWGIRSGVSYSGGTNLAELRRNAEFVKVTSQSMAESGHRL